jgi:hypothetical protein
MNYKDSQAEARASQRRVFIRKPGFELPREPRPTITNGPYIVANRRQETAACQQLGITRKRFKALCKARRHDLALKKKAVEQAAGNNLVPISE